MCGSPRHKICTASLDNRPLIDGFVLRLFCPFHAARQAPPDAITVSRLVCRVGIPCPTQASLSRQLAALPFIAATHLHLARLIRHREFALRHLPSVIRHLPSAICPLAFAIRLLAFAICRFSFPIFHSEFRIPHSAQRLQRPQQFPRLGRLVAPVPLERRAAIQREGRKGKRGITNIDGKGTIGEAI